MAPPIAYPIRQGFKPQTSEESIGIASAAVVVVTDDAVVDVGVGFGDVNVAVVASLPRI